MATTIDEKCLPFLREEDRPLVKQLLEASGFRRQPIMGTDSRADVQAYWAECARICKENNIQIDGC